QSTLRVVGIGRHLRPRPEAPRSGLEGRASSQERRRQLDHPSRAPLPRGHLRMRPRVSSNSPRVAIIGRPNVGKSTLFNRLVGRKLALVDDEPGVTRDRREGDAQLADLAFTIVDTAGLEEGDPETLVGRMRAQTETALADCDAILFVFDARAGLTAGDRHFAQAVRRAGKP